MGPSPPARWFSPSLPQGEVVDAVVARGRLDDEHHHAEHAMKQDYDTTTDYSPVVQAEPRSWRSPRIFVPLLLVILLAFGFWFFLLLVSSLPAKPKEPVDPTPVKMALEASLPGWKVDYIDLESSGGSRDADGSIAMRDRQADLLHEHDGKLYRFWVTNEVDRKVYRVYGHEKVKPGQLSEVHLDYVLLDGQEQVAPGGAEMTPVLRDFLLDSCRRLVDAAKKAGL